MSKPCYLLLLVALLLTSTPTWAEDATGDAAVATAIAAGTVPAEDFIFPNASEGTAQLSGADVTTVAASATHPSAPAVPPSASSPSTLLGLPTLADLMHQLLGSQNAQAAAAASTGEGAVSAQTVGAGGGAAWTDAARFKNLLDEHNRYRALHGVPALTWSTTLAASAAKYAATCPTDQVKDATNTLYGENVQLLGVTGQLLRAYGSDTDFLRRFLINFSTYSWRMRDIGAFSNTTDAMQVVWRAATQVGCALQTCSMQVPDATANKVENPFLTCRYNKRASNVPAEVNKNVPPMLATHTLPYGFGFTTTASSLPGATGSDVNCMTSATKYKLCLQPADGQLVLTNARGKTVWSTNILYAPKDPAVAATKAVATMNADFFSVGAANGRTADWFTTKPGGTFFERLERYPARLVLGDNGSLRVLSVSDQVLWSLTA